MIFAMSFKPSPIAPVSPMMIKSSRSLKTFRIVLFCISNDIFFPIHVHPFLRYDYRIRFHMRLAILEKIGAIIYPTAARNNSTTTASSLNNLCQNEIFSFGLLLGMIAINTTISATISNPASSYACPSSQ